MSEQTSQNKPTAAYILSLLTGIANVLGGVALLILAMFLAGAYDSELYFFNFFFGSVILTGLGIWALIAGTIITVAAVKLNSNPLEHSKWGLIILIFSIGAASILGIIGGILALTFDPGVEIKTRMCLGCGLHIDEKLRFCPHCGKASQD